MKKTIFLCLAALYPGLLMLFSWQFRDKPGVMTATMVVGSLAFLAVLVLLRFFGFRKAA